MNRFVLLLSLASLTALHVANGQQGQPVAPAPEPASPAQPVTTGRHSRRAPAGATTVPAVPTPTPAPPAAYYPPAGSLQAPLTADEVCRSLRGGLSGAEVAQDVRERGFTGTFGEDEAADARAAGAAPDLTAALQAGRFTVSPAYAQRRAAQAAKGRQATEANAWRAEASARAQTDERENERWRQGQIAAEHNRAIAVKEWEDKRRFQEMKDKADWESRQRQNLNANNYWYNGRYYGNRTWSGGRWHYY